MGKIIVKDKKREKVARRNCDFRSCVGCWRIVY